MLTHKSIVRLLLVLFNVAIMLVLLIGSAAFPIHAQAAITITTTDDNLTADG